MIGTFDMTWDAMYNYGSHSGETDPCEINTHNDGIQDGTELGVRLSDIGSDTDTGIFQPDLDPATTTDPLNADTDGDGFTDGEEDKNANGRRDPPERDLSAYNGRAMPWIPLLLGKQ